MILCIPYKKVFYNAYSIVMLTDCMLMLCSSAQWSSTKRSGPFFSLCSQRVCAMKRPTNAKVIIYLMSDSMSRKGSEMLRIATVPSFLWNSKQWLNSRTLICPSLLHFDTHSFPLGPLKKLKYCCFFYLFRLLRLY